MTALTPDYYIPPGESDTVVERMIIVPFVGGMLRDETMAAVHASGEAYLTVPINPDDPYEYAAQFRQWWNLPMDLVIVEQDIVPTLEQIDQLTAHPHDWTAMAYHVGDGRYATGLGFCKITAALRQRRPHGGVNASLDPANARELVHYTSLNENVERHLTRLGEHQTVLPGKVVHLHYPEPSGA
ncbi:MAG TPA: hypothetical protein VHT26_07620 [Trebonia sp.]|jgi:hypothetical protein|nr:hypothetical protein [Trebonia sp.]